MQEKGKTQLRLLATSHAMNHVYQLLIPVVIPEITREYGLSDFTAGLLISCFFVSYALLPALLGYLSQAFGRRRFLAFGFATTALAFLATAFTSNIAMLALLFFIAGAGGSTYHPNGFPILAETYPTSRGQTLGLHQTGGAIGSFVGPAITGILIFSFTWKPTMMILAIPGLVLAAVLWFSIGPERKPEQSTPQQRSKVSFAYLKNYGPAMLFIGAAFVYVLGQRGTDVFANQYFVYGRGIEIAEASILFSTLKIAGLFSAPICGRLSDAYGRKKVLITLIIIESASLYAITELSNMLLVIPCLVFGFAAFGLLTVGEALLADITPEKQRGTIFGINLTINFSPSIFLAPALGAIAQLYGFDLGFIILSAIMLVSIPLLLQIKTKPTSRP
jgi:FSR family fosmidomycin resistance protein-like MFS transporter